MAGGGVLGQCEEDLGPQPELIQEGHSESIYCLFFKSRVIKQAKNGTVPAQGHTANQ